MSVPSAPAPAPLVPPQGTAPAATTRLDATAGSSGGQSHPSVPLLPPSPPHILGTDGQAHTRTAGAERKSGHSQLYLRIFS